MASTDKASLFQPSWSFETGQARPAGPGQVGHPASQIDLTRFGLTYLAGCMQSDLATQPQPAGPAMGAARLVRSVFIDFPRKN